MHWTLKVKTTLENVIVLLTVTVIVIAAFRIGNSVHRWWTVCGDCEHGAHRGYFCGAPLPREIQELPNGMVCGCDKAQN